MRAAGARLSVARYSGAAALPPIGGRLNLHQAHEGAAEAAGAGIAEAHGDLRYALAGLGQKATGRVEAHLRDQLAVARAHFGKMSLQRTSTHAQLPCGFLKRCAIVLQRRRDHGLHCHSGGHVNELHRLIAAIGSFGPRSNGDAIQELKTAAVWPSDARIESGPPSFGLQNTAPAPYVIESLRPL